MNTPVKKLLHLLKSTTSNNPDKPQGDITATAYQFNVEIIHKDSTIHDNVTEFWFRPNKKISLIKVIVRIENDEDVIAGNKESEYSGNDWHLLAGYEDVRVGDVWEFTFSCTFANRSEVLTRTVKYVV